MPVPPEDQESRKIDLLYHATAHFEVRKFVHNAKQEELKYDHMIEVLIKGPAKSTRSTSKLTQWQTPVTVTLIL